MEREVNIRILLHLFTIIIIDMVTIIVFGGKEICNLNLYVSGLEGRSQIRSEDLVLLVTGIGSTSPLMNS